MSDYEYTYQIPECPSVIVSLGFHHFAGRAKYSYELEDDGKVVFEGTDFGPAPHVDPYSRESVMHLLGFLTLQPGVSQMKQ